MPDNHGPNDHAAQQSDQFPATQGPGAGGRDVEIFDSENPRSLINLVPAAFQEAIRSTLATHGDLLELDETEFKARLKDEKRYLTPTDHRIRLRFWDAYDRAQAESKTIAISHAFSGICTRDHFYKKYLKDPYRLAWLLCPPASYLTIAEEALSYGLEQLRGILGMDDYEKDPKSGTPRLNMNLLKLKVKIVEMLDTRKSGAGKGPVVQVNVGATGADVNTAALGLSMEEMQRQMKELEKRERLAVRGAQPVIEDGEVIAT